MNNKIIWIRLAVFAVILLSAIAYPVTKIIQFEFPAIPPRVFRFRCELVDPYEPFRGRYVRLSPRPEMIDLPVRSGRNSPISYAVLGTDEKGMATVLDLVGEPPADGRPFVRIRYRGYYPDWSRNGDSDKKKSFHHIKFPFDRFYMNEHLAPEAEKAMNRSLVEQKNGCAVVVRIYSDGNFAVDDLELKGFPIRDVLKSGSSRKK